MLTATSLPRCASWISLAAGIGLAGALGACTGNIGDRARGGTIGAGPTGGVNPDASGPGLSPLRRLTTREYLSTVADLFPGVAIPDVAFPGENAKAGFDNDADQQATSPSWIEDYEGAALAIAGAAIAVPDVVGCAPQTAAEEQGCGATFLESFGKRAFRRPLEDEERTRLLAFFEKERQAEGFAKAAELLIAAILQAPQFLYRVEYDLAPADDKGFVTLDAYELATRLSYFLWGTMPDEELFAAADDGTLLGADVLAAQAERMLAEDRARAMVRDFHYQWLGLRRLATTIKDVALFPKFDDALMAAMTTETEMFAEHTVFDGEGTLGALLTDAHSFVNGPLADLYGAAAPSGSGFALTALDPAQRAGLLTQGSFLASHGHPKLGSPVLRGLAVSRSLLCFNPPPPPPNVDTSVTKGDPMAGKPKTTRELFEQHLADPKCKGCHQTFDPYGYSFESFDALGAFRTIENGEPVDTKSDIGDVGGDGNDVTVKDAVELAHVLAASPRVHACVAKQWFRYAFGRIDAVEDAGVLDAITGEFSAADLGIQALILATVESKAFATRQGH